ncbi:MAG TPA: 2-oxo-4-hydroxy-4-carboxy-5-ureidoimidazoline decarboxylase [Spirochaetia bacterium]|nr:2-oxo-4-hydroxy-4-carboxy-5-ureidoimidazoline decarboxylase [Spirochaetia bacterium]
MQVRVKTSLAELNAMNEAGFVAVCGPLFEHSPWIAARTWQRRPFPTLQALHEGLVATVQQAARQEQLALINAHPDLVGRLAREGRLSRNSAAEQAAAGLSKLSAGEIAVFERCNREYREKFDLPFIICARENKKEAILAAFPVRLAHTREQEIAAALAEIAKIARFRLLDAVTEG